MTILITGTAGFIGFHVASYYIQKGNTVYGIDNINDYYDVDLKYNRLKQHGVNRENIKYNELVTSRKYPNYSFIKLDIADNEKLTHFFRDKKIDYVCNLAAQAGVRYSIEKPQTTINSNLLAFVNLIEASKNNGVKHFVYASSSSVYGLNAEMPFSEAQSLSHPVSLYAATKKSNELIAHSYSHLFEMPTTGLRFFSVYGPWGRPDMALFIFTKAILENKTIDIYNNGKMYRDFTYIDDIVHGISKVIENAAIPNPSWSARNPDPATSSAPYKIYNIGNNNPIRLLDFVEEIEKVIGKKAHRNFLPLQPGDVVQNYADVNRLSNEYGYKSTTSIPTGIRKFVNWYREYFKV